VKVSYVTLEGHTSTAYLDRQEGERWVGANKYTDEPVTVYWNDDDEIHAWCEVAQ